MKIHKVKTIYDDLKGQIRFLKSVIWFLVIILILSLVSMVMIGFKVQIKQQHHQYQRDNQKIKEQQQILDSFKKKEAEFSKNLNHFKQWQ